MATGWNLRGTVTITSNGTTTPTAGSWPTGATVGDLIVIRERCYNVSTTLVAPKSGSTTYTQIDGAPYIYQATWGRYFVASEPAPTLGTQSSQTDVSIAVFYLVGYTAPAIGSLQVSVSHGGTSTTNLGYSALATAPGVNGCLMLMHAAASATATTVTTDTGNYTNALTTNAGSGSHPISSAFSYFIQGTSATVTSGDSACTGMSSSADASIVMALSPGTLTGGVAITSSPSTCYPAQTGLAIAGTFSASGNSVTITDGTNVATQNITAQSATSITFTCVQSNLRYLSGLVLTVTNNASQSATASIQLVTASGVFFTNVNNLRLLTTTPQAAGNATPSRLYDPTTDLTNPCQVEYSVQSGSGSLTVNADASVTWAVAVKGILWRWIASTGSGTWSTQYTWALVGLFPAFTGTIGNQSYNNSQTVSLPLAGQFSDSDPDETTFTYSLSSGSLTGSGLTLGSSTGTISGTAATGTYSGLVVQCADPDGSYAQTNSFNIVVTAGTNVIFSGAIPNYPNLVVGTPVTITTGSTYFTNATSYSETGTLPGGLSIASGTGTISGTPNGSGIPTGQSTPYSITVTGSGTGNPATSNSFTLTVSNPAVGDTVPNFQLATWTQANASSTLVSAGLVGSFPTPWTGAVDVSQSINAGTVVPAGSTVIITPTQAVVPQVPSPSTQAAAFSYITAANMTPAATVNWTGSVPITQSIVANSLVPIETILYITPLGVPGSTILSGFTGTFLITNGFTTTPNNGLGWQGGAGMFVVVGTFNTATIQLQFLGPDGLTWVTYSGSALTAPGEINFYLPPCNLRAEVIGGPPSGIYAAVNRVIY
jgi:Putative Ig domain